MLTQSGPQCPLRHYLTSYYWSSTICILTFWPTGPTCLRQWTSVYIRWIHPVSEAKWNQTHSQCSISSLIKRSCRMFCSDILASYVGWREGWSVSQSSPISSFSPTELLHMQQQMPHLVSCFYKDNCKLVWADHKGLIASRQATQKKHHDGHTKLRSLVVGSPVVVRDFRHNSKWIPGTIVKKLGPVTYHVDLGGGNIVKRHIDQLVQRLEPLPVTPNETNGNLTIEDNFQYPETVAQPRQEPVVEAQPYQRDRYPQRVRWPPDRLMTVLD